MGNANMATIDRSTDGSAVDDHAQNRLAQIRAIAALTKTARDDALELDLKFEAYLLDMAVVALSEIKK